ncbi:MAG: FAD-dependent oxidoreductase [Acidobacteriota bacterium]
MPAPETHRASALPILVVGGGIAGMTCAIEAAEAGNSVVLVEKAAYLGGRVAGFHQYFPKLCPPSCGIEINLRRLRSHPAITVYTLAELKDLSGQCGDYEAIVRLNPRYVSDCCTACGECSRVCPSEAPDPFDYGMSNAPAIRLPHRFAWPVRYAVDRDACMDDCHACVDACRYAAVDLNQQPALLKLRVASLVIATGWAPYDATRIDNLGFHRFVNVVSNVMLERQAAVDGPTAGRILRPSDGKPPRAIAFVQCAGSRDENYLPYCSGVCCTASLKHAAYLRSQYPEAKITMFYIDLRTPGELDRFAAKMIADTGIELIKGKVARVQEHPASRDLLVTAEDVLRGRKITREYDLLVLATGMVPQTADLPIGIRLDEFGFVKENGAGIYAAGCAWKPENAASSVQNATGAALKAMQSVSVEQPS